MERGMTQTAAAKRIGVTDRTMRNWMARHRREGDAGLADRPRSGKPSKLSARQKADLARRLLKGAKAEGFDGDLWTCSRIREVVRRRYKVEYHRDALPYVLKSLGFSCQKPQLKAVERDEAAIATWVARDWPRIKKSRTSSGSARVRR